MSETEEKLLDSALLEQFDIDPYLKLSVGVSLVVHRQLLLLSQEKGRLVSEMNREFLIEELCKVKVTESVRKEAAKLLNKLKEQ